MSTIKLNVSKNWSLETANQESAISIRSRLLGLADSQAKNKTFWFMASLVIQGVLFLPIPAAMIYYFNAPIPIVTITLVLFFANVIAGMGGAGIRTLLSLFFASVFVHMVMLAIFII